jgi:hypothetical protein
VLAISSRLYRGTSHPTHGRTLTAEGLLEVIEAVLDVTDAAGRSADTGGHNREVFDDGFEPTCSRGPR